MSIDMSQFLSTFYEESFEGLDVMESELLDLDVGEADAETINTIFRAAHSIKGGSGTFGLNAVASFTHVMETLLDEMREGKREVTQQAVDILLRSVDVLRDMLTSLKNNEELELERIEQTHQELESLLKGENSSPTPARSEAQATATIRAKEWVIKFKPHREMFKTGNDSVRIIRELACLGDIEVEADTSELPDLDNLDPEQSYLSWTIILTGETEESAIKECFEWVDDECDLSITAIAESAPENNAGPEHRTGERRKGEQRRGSAEAASIRVSIDKVDDLINRVGELVITQSMLSQVGDIEEFNASTLDRLQDGLSQLEQHTRELQESVMRIRMMPISFAFQRFPRLVHDLSQQFGKNIELNMSGEQTELDKTVMEKIGDPLVHLVRNSLDHGIEMPDVRLQAGKPQTGKIELNAYHQGGNIVIEIKDDGAGLNKGKILNKAIENGLVKEPDELSDEEIHDLIFRPGFSTADVVSDVSGRGVGMDVVRRNIRSLGGTVEVKSEEGKGSVFTIRLPLTLAILDGQTIAVGKEDYIVPLVSIIESIQPKPETLNVVVGKGETFKLRNEHLPIIRLHKVFNAESVTTDLSKGLLVVVEGEGRKACLFVDELRGQQQVVIKSLEANYKRIDGISGATILGDGSVALILDIPGLIKLSNNEMAEDQSRKIA